MSPSQPSTAERLEPDLPSPRSTEFYDIMDMIDKRLNDKGKNWRHVLKALKVLDYCLHEGSELVVTWARANSYIIKTLREFQYVDEDGRDVGQNGMYVPLCEMDLPSPSDRFIFISL